MRMNGCTGNRNPGWGKRKLRKCGAGSTNARVSAITPLEAYGRTMEQYRVLRAMSSTRCVVDASMK